MRIFSTKKLLTVTITTTILFTVFIWWSYRQYDHLQAVAGVDHFVWQYIKSMKNGTDFYLYHSCDNFGCNDTQAENATNLAPRYQLPYTMESKTISGGPYWQYDTAFQIVLRFDNTERLYLHVRYLNGAYQASVVPWSKEPINSFWSDGRSPSLLNP